MDPIRPRNTRRRPAERIARAAAAATFAAAWSAGAAAQDLPPTYGTRILSASEVGRVSIDLQAGGALSAQQYLGPACVGMVAEAPDFRIDLEGPGTADLDFRVQSAADTTLVVLTPEDDWLCNDDWNGLNPAVEILSAEPGDYDVWVGTFESSGLPAARLTVAARPVPDDVGRPTASAQDAPAEWWYATGGGREGPVSLDALEAAIEDGSLDRDTLVWRDGMDGWQAAGSVDAVSGLFPAEPPPLPAAEAATPPPLPEEEESAAPPPLPDEPAAGDDAPATGAAPEDDAASGGGSSSGAAPAAEEANGEDADDDAAEPSAAGDDGAEPRPTTGQAPPQKPTTAPN